jgi:hypothetical protein
MATYDTNRAAFVQQEYRYATKTNPAVLARNPAARTVEIDTNLDEATASSLSTKYLNENGSPRVFEIVVEGVLYLDAFVGGVPAYQLNLPKFSTDGRTYKVISFTTDYDINTTTLQVRG